jgi:predicted dehydrogenase
MRIGFNGQLEDHPRVRAGFIGCGSHAFRNVYPTFQFAPVELVATCDLDADKARAFAKQFGATGGAYGDYREMLRREQLDAVFIVTGYDADGRPLYPAIAADCVRAGVHVWMEKPPAATSRELTVLRDQARQAGRTVMCGLKKMFFPANRKARSLSSAEAFGPVQLVTIEYPQYVPTVEQFAAYRAGGSADAGAAVVSFLDHLCHPAALLLYLLGMPRTLSYARSAAGAGLATFTFDSGAVASLILSHLAPVNGGMERTEIIGGRGQRVVVENNVRVTLSRPGAGHAYGRSTDYFDMPDAAASLAWEPEFSLGQLYNKGLFLLGYYDEVNEFARAVLEKREPTGGTLEHAWQVTRIFEAFAEGPGKTIELTGTFA